MGDYTFRKSSEPPFSTMYSTLPPEYIGRSNSEQAERMPFLNHVPISGPRRKRLNTLEVTSANLTTFLQSKSGRRRLSLLSNHGEDVLRFGEAIRQGKQFYPFVCIRMEGESSWADFFYTSPSSYSKIKKTVKQIFWFFVEMADFLRQNGGSSRHWCAFSYILFFLLFYSHPPLATLSLHMYDSIHMCKSGKTCMEAVNALIMEKITR